METISYSYGKIPILLCSVHDGKLEVSVPERINPESVIKNDMYTSKICEDIIKNISSKLGYKPYYIYNNIHRKYIDLNRKYLVGTEHKITKQHWKKFHNTLENMIKHCLLIHNHCLLLDFHGNSKTHNLIQLGYGISDEDIGTYKDYYKSTLVYLSKFYTNNSLIYNNRSLSSFFKNTEVFPRLNTNLTRYKKIYYNGGYIIRHYSKKYNIDSIQIELSKNLRTNISIDLIDEFSNSIILFYFTNYYPLIFKKIWEKNSNNIII